MSTLTTTRNYQDGDILFESDLDAALDDVETFLNITKISDDNIQTGGITGSTKLADGTVTAVKLAADSVTTAKILDANVTAAKLASDSVTTVKVLDANITTAKIADNAITTAKIAASQITTSKIAGLNVTTATIAAGAVTQAKLASKSISSTASAGDIALASSSGNFLTTSSTPVDVTSQSITITTTGRPVWIALLPGATTDCNLRIQASTTSAAISGSFYIVRGGTTLAEWTLADQTGTVDFKSIAVPPSAIAYLDAPSAGTYTYKLQAAAVAGTTTNALNVTLCVYEL